jgi:hypothetical protein
MLLRYLTEGPLVRVATLILGLILFMFCTVFGLGLIAGGSSMTSLASALGSVSTLGQDAVYFGWAIFGVGILSAFGAAFSLNIPRASAYFFAFGFIGAFVATILIGLHNGSIGPFIGRMWPFALASLLLAVFSYYGEAEIRKESLQ